MSNKENEFWHKKSFDDLTIADDFMFCLVMQDPSICKQLLEITVGDKIGKIKSISYQRTFIESISAKSIRLDVLVTDETGRVYNMEMQVGKDYNIPKRSRYYVSSIDASFLNKGEDYETLPEVFVIFFCKYDPFKKGLPKYTQYSCFEEYKNIQYSNGITNIIITDLADTLEKNAELADFIRLMKNKAPLTNFGKMVQSKVDTEKQKEENRRQYAMFTPIKILDARREARLEGLVEGREEGLLEGETLGVMKGELKKARETALAFKKMGLSISQIAKGTGLTEEEVEKL
ncbi:MAG: Rpn family recombination-promoting nuclease/putative transposase [Treponemataceae bacterium]